MLRPWVAIAFVTGSVAPCAAQTPAWSLPLGRLVRAEIVFDAKATVADFQGRAQVAVGEFEGGAALAEVRGCVEVRWRDIDTRNGTRNRHMLQTVDEARYPVIHFELAEALPQDVAADSAAVLLRGSLSLHGVTRAVEWPALVRVQPPGDSVSVVADFPVDMRDYGIKPPVRLIIARMGAVVRVHVKLVFVP